MSDGTTRRGLLATLAVTGVAGCSGVDELPGVDRDRTIESRRLPSVGVDDSTPETRRERPVAPAFPVSVAAAQFRRHHDRVTTLLAELPTPLSAATVPNGRVRTEIAAAVRDATTALADARAAQTERVALRRLRDARSEAGYAAAGWGFATGEREPTAVQASLDEVVDEARETRTEHERVAGEPVVAAVGHATVEFLLERAADRHAANADSRLLRVAETGGATERARAALADARHLDERLAETGDERHTERIRAAAERLSDRFRERQSEVTTPTPAPDRSLGSETVRELDRVATAAVGSVATADGPATALLTSTHELATLSAFETITDRVAAGDLDRVESAAWVRRRREAAATAVESALGDAPAPALARPTVVDAGRRLGYGDRRIARLRDRNDVPPGRLFEPVADYVVAETLADAAGEASAAAADTLRD